MAKKNKPPRPWIVSPHGPIRQIDDNLWVVDGPVPGIPGGNFPRRMHIVRLGDGTLLLHNAVPLDERGMKELLQLGRISILFVPSPFHCIDAHAMKERTGARVIAPARSASQIEAIVHVDGGLDALPPDPCLRVEELDGARWGEAMLFVKSADGQRENIVVCDVVLNVPNQPGFWGFMWRLFGFTGGPRCGPVWLKRAVTDRKALRAHIERIAARPGLTRLLPSHGDIIEKDVAGTLRAVAAPL